MSDIRKCGKQPDSNQPKPANPTTRDGRRTPSCVLGFTAYLANNPQVPIKRDYEDMRLSCS